MGLEAKVVEIRDTDFPREVMEAQRILHSYKGGSLDHLFHLFRAVRGAREDPGVQHEPKDKTKSKGNKRIVS